MSPPVPWRRTLLPVVLAAALMAPGIGEPYGGFLAYSEAWYTLVARGFSHGSLLLPEVAPGRPDFNIPPLFAWLLHAGFVVAGPSEAVARLVAIAGALLAVAAVARFASPAAALLLASTPAFVLVGRNVQPDGWALAFALAAYSAWRRPRGALASGVLFAFALFTKPTVVLLALPLAVAETVRARGLGWLGRRHVAWAAVAALPSVAWTLLQLALHRDLFLAGLRHGEGAFEWPSLALVPTLLGETVFAFFPVLALLTPLAIVRFRREPDALHPSVVLATGLLLLGVMHYHGYYLVALIPAAAVLSGRLLQGRAALTAALVALNALAALVLLGGHKLGRTEVADLAGQARGATFVMSRDAYEGYWTLIALYGEPRAIRVDTCASATATEPVVALPAPDPGQANLFGRGSAPRPFALAGIGITEGPENPHRLTWGPLAIRRAPGLWLGFGGAPQTALGAWRVPPGVTVCPDGADHRE